ncbi:DsbE family thiol:disulfide interchange protein [Methylovirgula sp. HY1]|uniref:DsbE family thiol:disulfide interchange protein n=1 Tax=Methylovirgula sp. HY1 TaxID=2822761 RepID=UPI001C5B84ED|nr:DsbE family thiol:disulfide interchange protein [Methylovirgula sp. HY1]QXX75180.1 Thiol:disulfide interchange protein CycY [Methylovirgula sp. HY1]
MNETREPVIVEDAAPEPVTRRSQLVLLPLVFFAALAALFLVRLFAGDDSRLPSALIGQEAPHFDLPAITGLTGHPGLSDADLRHGHVTVLNIFASWCVPCHQEHPFLLSLSQDATLAKEGVTIVGIAYKDKSENIRRFLGEAGDPYARVGADTSGRTGVDFGVYGVPETYIVKGNGKIAFKFVGPMNADSIRSTILPQIEKARR